MKNPDELWQTKRDTLRRWLDANPVANVSREEIEAHFDGMPRQYWERISEAELAWGLETVNRFLTGLVASPSGATPAVVTWKHFPKQGVTKALVSTWDRAGLLAKIAGYTSALRLNIVRAEVYTRADNIVLDVFWVSDGEGKHVEDAERLSQLAFLVEGGLSEPPRFVSTWACESHKYTPRSSETRSLVHFDNAASRDCTVLTIQTGERLGVLHDMLQVLTANNLNITDALIDTFDDVARDIFFVTDEHKRKIDPARFAEIEKAIVAGLG